MKKRYTSDPKQASRRNAFANKKNFLALLAFLAVCPVAWAWYPPSAGTYYLRSTGTDNNFNVYTQANGQGNATATNQTQLNSFTISSGTYTLVFENTFPIIMNGRIFIDADASTEAKLHMQLGTGASANPTLKIIGNGGQPQAAFFINNVANTDRTKHVIIIEGNDPSPNSSEDIPNYVYDFSNNFVIDGDGPVMTVEDDGTSIPKMKVTTAGNRKSYGLFRIQEGTLTMKNVTVQNFATTWANGGVIQVYTNQNNAKVLADIDHCHFKSIASRTEIVLKVQSDGTYNDQPATGLNEGLRDAKFKNCKIEYTFGCNTTYSTLELGDTQTVDTQNGTFRSIGKNSVTISLENCHLTNNYGCPVRWHGSRSKDKLIVDHCKIENNYTLTGSNVNGGGGLLLKGPAQISQCTIQYNRTNGDGGGIYLSTYTDFGNGTEDLVPDHSILELDDQTLIDNNTAAGNGGGVAINGLEMNNTTGVPYPNGPNYIWFNPDGEPFKLRFVLGGATISNNKARGGDGGGVWINRYNRVTYFKLECELDKGTISTNQCSRNGGGVAIITTSTFSNPSGMPSTVVPQNVTVTIGREGETTNKISIDNNTAATYGGGMYVEAYPITYNGTTSEVSTSVYDYSEITGNTATSHGGGLYVKRGTVNVTQSGSKQPLIQGNMANTYHGGGIYLDDGTINISGGLVKDNKAKAHGGGIYNNNGNISLSDNSEVSGNKAGTYNSGTYGNGGGIYTQTGAVSVNLSTIKNNEAYNDGGGVYTNSGSITLLSATIGGNAAADGNRAVNRSGGGLYTASGDVLINHLEAGTTSPSNISYNTAELHGGGIYNQLGRVVAYGSFDGETDYPIQITHNKATTGSGGGIFCMGNSGSSEYDIRLRRINVSNNSTDGTADPSNTINLGCGGGVYLDQGKISIINGTITNNTANVGGGGIYTREGDIDINPTQDERHASSITNNKAGLNGGGLNTNSGHVRIYGNNKDQRIVVSGNEATTGSGGGIFCYGTDVNEKYITVRHADLTNNQAKDGGGTQTVLASVVSGCGGGMYLQQGKITVTNVKIQNNSAKLNGGGINNHEGNIDVNGCLIGGGESLGNTAEQSGGGIYTRAGDIDIKDYVENSGSIVRYESKITHNSAVENGGGVDTRSGTIYVNRSQKDDQIEISYNTAKKGGGLYANAGTIIVYNANIDNNTATINGGGINNHSGNILIYGGTLSNNHANTGHGGGAYTNVGDIDIYPFPENSQDLRQGTMVFNNLALKNGGAFNNHTGRVDARYATLFNNTASQGNGGGIFCEGPHTDATGYTIRLLGSQIVQNKTRGQDGTAAEPTGRGGGIYTKYGDIFAQDSWIYQNSANRHGGGINNHEGTILVYGCNIENNTAVEGKGGGIFANDGDIHIGPCYNNSESKSQSTVIKNNFAYENGGGINNHKGNITLNGDYITDNTAATGDGGGVYIANGQIDMWGGKIARNTANSGNGGGVYSGGGQFNIEKRPDNPTPTVVILNADVSREGGSLVATIHYHVVDRGNNSGASPEHGISWGATGTENTCTYNSVSPPSGYECNLCDGSATGYKIKIKTGTIAAGTSYKVKAFYSYNSGAVTGYSDLASFTAFANAPTVVTGTVTNLTRMAGSTTRYQAEVSGKVFDGGSSDITAKGVEWKADGGSYSPIASSEELDFFTVALTNLLPNTKYYVRAYATNGSGTSYGDEVTFTTPRDLPDMGTNDVVVTGITSNSANFSFTMPDGTTFGSSPAITSYGFVWSTDDDPELKPEHIIPATGTSGTTFTASISTLSPSTTYYVRAYASKSAAEPAALDIDNYSITTPVQFITPSDNNAPVVRATRITNITQHAADITGQLIYNGTPAVSKYGIVWSWRNTEPTMGGTNCVNIENTATLSDGAEFTIHIPAGSDTLKPNQTYYVRTYATNTSGEGGTEVTVYSNNFNFTALPVTIPNVLITDIRDITKTTANVDCKVSDGGGTITDWGVKYSVNSDMSGAIDVNQPGTTLSGSTFTAHLPKTGEPDLTAHTKYYVQAYATNSAGTHTCQVVEFTTDYDKPTVVFNTPAIDQVSFDANAAVGSRNTARGNYKVTPVSGTTVKTHGVAWSTFHNPTRSQSDVANTHFVETISASVTAETNLNQTITQKYPNTRYYVRAYASTEDPADDVPNGIYVLDNIVYSTETSFVTLPAMETGTATNIGITSATLGGTIASRDTEGNLVNGYYGVCWGTSTNPTRADGYYAEQQITTANASTFNYSLAATTNIAYGSTYHYRAYYKSSGGDIAYGADATFSPLEHGVTVVANPAAGGAVSVVYNGDGTCTVTATPNEGYTFINWTGGPTDPSTENPYTFTIGTGYTLTANFTNTYAVTFSFTDGTVTVDASSVTSGTPVDFTYGTTYVLEAAANSGYHFVSWKIGEDVLSTEESFSYTMNQTAATTITVVFESDSKGRESTSGVGPSAGSASPRPRDIYPAPAREPWLWDEEWYEAPLCASPSQSGSKGESSPASRNNNMGSLLGSSLLPPAPLTEGEAYRSADVQTDTLPFLDSLDMLRNRDAIAEPVALPMIDHNTAERGGGIFMAKNDDPLNRAKLVFAGGSSAGDKGQIILNSATLAGGGIYIDTTAHMQMKGHCEVNGNHVPAGKPGGGIYLAGRLYVGNTGSAASDNGLKVNQNFAMDGFNESSYTSDAATYTTTNKRFLNNVLLARHTYYYAHTTPVGTYDDEAAVITLLSDISDKDGGGNPYSNIGFHVSHGFCPVIATSYAFGGEYALAQDGISTEFHGNTLDTYESWLSNLMEAVGAGGTLGSNSAVFEDTESYIAIHTTIPGDPFHSKYIYLWGCWTHPAVLYDPETSHMSGQTNFQGHYKITNSEDNADPAINTNPLHWEIYSAEGLAWFSSYVNGLNAFKDGDIGSGGNHYPYNANKNPKATAKLMNDIDLSAFYWVPIGSVTQYNGATAGAITSGTIFTDDPSNSHHFKGTIDGQGHTITGMKCQYVSGIFKNGLVGYLDGGTVKNVFIDEAIFVANNHADKGYYIGGVAGSMEGSATISAVEVRSSIDVTNTVLNKDKSYVGGLVGEMKGSGNVVHSCMAMPEIIGAVDYMGGLVGEIEANNQLLNSFANACFPNATTTPYYVMNTDKYIGGLVGENKGTVANCYSRLKGNEPTSDGSSSVFGWLAGTNNGTIQYCYAPQAVIAGGSVYKQAGNNPTDHGTYTVTTRVDGKYGYKHRDHAIALASGGTNDYINNDTLVGGLQRALNAWVRTNGKTTYHPWMRTMASTINDDLPILNFMKDGAKALGTNPAYNAVGTEDGWYMKYVNDVNELLTTYAALTSGTPDIYLYDENTDADGTTPKDITVTNVGTTPPVKFEIHPDVGIKVSGAAASTGLNARVGVTLHNNRSDWTDPNWHLFSAAVEDPHIGLVYHTDDATTMNMGGLSGYSDGTYVDNIVNNASKPQHLDNVYGVRQYFDPPQTTWHPTNLGYFPTDTPYGTWRTTPASTGFFDLYAYSESFYHWINYKREGSASYMDHWHMDPEHGTMLHHKINYTNDTRMRAGMGFLTALAHETLIMADGKLNQGNKSVIVTHTPTSTNTPPAGSYGTYNYNLEWRRLNLIGNPYQSYLDFKKFCDGNSNIEHTYGTREDGGKKYIFYTYGESDPTDASQFIHPHQGFFVKVTAGYGSYMLNFTDAMRVAGTASSLSSPYRSDVNYPLVILNCYDPEGDYDKTKIEVNRPELGGGSKMHNLHNGNAKIYASFEGNDYQTLFTPEGVNEVPVRFEAMEDGVYTIKWETHNGNFHYLHLIDNLAGTDTDCLSKSEYKFEGKTSDYHSRFKLVFGCVGIEENDDSESDTNFAFINGEELFINGAGDLYMFDITGRCVMSTRTAGEQASVSLPKVSAGVYLLRLEGGEQVKIQKIIIQ